MLKICQNVQVHACDLDYFVFRAPEAEARRLLLAGRATIKASDPRRGITVIALVDGTAKVDARPGSFGIIHEHLPSGHTAYRHQPTHERAIAA